MNTHKNLQTRTDQELIHEFISGYQPCLEVLIARHKSKIYTSIYLLVKSYNTLDLDPHQILSIANVGVVIFTAILGLSLFKEKFATQKTIGLILCLAALGFSIGFG